MNKDKQSIRLSPEPLIRKLARDGRFVDKSTVCRWRRTGLDLFVADRLCCRFGYHPFEVYGTEFYQNIEEGADA